LALTVLGLKIDERLAFGNEAQKILKRAKQFQTDLIMMGARGLVGIRRLLLEGTFPQFLTETDNSATLPGPTRQ
jgi:nucleotide-binding universal stress UspA family protein